MKNIKLWKGDCLELMKEIPDESIDFVCSDIPYGTTQCKWDIIIPFEPMWNQLNRVIKKNGTIALFGSEPFSSFLRMSNIKNYKYDWIWDKILKTGHLNAKKRPMLQHEIISIFAKKTNCYFPIMEKGNPQHSEGKKRSRQSINSENYGKQTRKHKDNKGCEFKYPSSLSLKIQKVHPSKCIHPTQKPERLLEYLISTYTKKGEIVLDFTMGSGTTGVACKKLNRRFLGIEKDSNYFKIAKERIRNS